MGAITNSRSLSLKNSFGGPPRPPFPPRTGPSGGGDRGDREPRFNADENRINERIRVPEVLVIDDLGVQLGVMNTREALALAREKGLDLVEVASTARPPVCKILDYGKLKYTKKKKTQEAKKKQTVVSIKEIQLRPRTEEHDLETKFRHLAEFLTYGDKVKITVMFRGREVAYAHQGQQMLLRIIESVKEIAAPEQYPKLEGRRMIMVLGPTGKPSENIDNLPALVSLASLKPKAFEGRIDSPNAAPGGLPVPGSAPGSLPIPGSAPGSLPVPGSALGAQAAAAPAVTAPAAATPGTGKPTT